MRRGRDALKYAQPYMHLLSIFFRVIPRSICTFAYNLIRYRRSLFFVGIRYSLLKRLANSVGFNVAIYENVILKNISNLSFGDNVSLHPNSYLDALGGIEIHSDVSIAHNCSMISFSHNFTDKNIPIKDQGINVKKIIIEDNVWIGANVTILPGVIIESGSIAAAGAVITKKVTKNTIVGGVPAIILKER